jgi:hypothetical protein
VSVEAKPDRQCPAWCSGEHSGNGLDVFHQAEIGRVEGGELTVVVSVTAWASPDMPDPEPAVTLMWHGATEDDTDVYLQDGIEFPADEVDVLIPLLQKAKETLRAGRRT